jgi:hypothetical protein
MPAWVAAAVAVVGAISGASAQEKQKQAADKAADAQRGAQNEQKAVVASQQASDRRALVREERVRRARIMQGAENSGTSGSSSEAGAVGSIATQYFGNMGTSLGGQRVAASITNFQQSAADFNFQGQQAQQQNVLFNQAVSAGASIFNATYTPSGSTSLVAPIGGVDGTEIDTGASNNNPFDSSGTV